MSQAEKITELGMKHLQELESIHSRLEQIVSQIVGTNSPAAGKANQDREGIYGFLNIQLNLYDQFSSRLDYIRAELASIEDAFGIGGKLEGNLAQAIAEDLRKGTFKGVRQGEVLAQVNEDGLTKTYRSIPNANR